MTTPGAPKRTAPSHIVWLLLLATAFYVAGCRSTPRNDPAAQATATAETKAAAESKLLLVGTAWEVAYFFDKDQQVAVLPDTRLTTNFLADRYTGSTGCNWYLGVYAVDTTALLFYAPAQTMVVCADEAVREQEALFLSTMANTIAYELKDGQLIAFTSEQQRLITFEAADPVPFEGTQWLLKFLADDGNAVSVLPASAASAQFEAGRLTGSGGCNGYEAPYTVDGGAMTIGEISAGTSICSEPADLMEQEAYFFEMLRSVVAYEQVGGMLLLYDLAGAPVLVLGAP